MTFQSILYERREDRPDEQAPQPPSFFDDLNCDQIVDAMTAPKQVYDLKPFFYASLKTVDAVRYRHEIMRDLEHPPLLAQVTAFARSMQDVRGRLLRIGKMFYAEQKQASFLEAVELYCGSIHGFVLDLAGADLRSRGFSAFRDYLSAYSRSAGFTALVSEAQKIKKALSEVRYCVLLKGSSFTVRKYDSETDYSVDVEQTFEKFKQGAVADYRVEFRASADMNHIEAKILEFVASLHPEVFLPLKDFCVENAGFLDDTVTVFDREVQFYVAYLDYIAPLKSGGLQFCYPDVVDQTKEVYDYDGFDIALAHKCMKEAAPLVCNDFELAGRERILVVSGPNQGGKTTFARAFGQLHYLASLGLPVPGRSARLYLFDQLFTHFEREERVETLRGKLEDDLVRIHAILDRATPRSIIVMNEIFTSTTLQDEIFLSTKMMERIIDLDLLCIWVTFVDEMASFGPQTVSMVSTIVPENPALRTFKIVRRPADGLAYAMAIARKHRLTYDSIMERMRP